MMHVNQINVVSEAQGLPACLGCSDCNGLCRELMDTLTVPGLVLRNSEDPELRVIHGGRRP